MNHLPITPDQSRRRKSAGFAPAGCLEMLMLAYFVAAVLNLALGNWVVATAMLVPLLALFLWVKYTTHRDRLVTGDPVRVSLGSHTGKEGVITGINESATRFTVQLSGSDCPEPVEFPAYHLTKIQPATTTPDETDS